MPERDSDTGQFVPDETYTQNEIKAHLRRCEAENGKVTRKLLNADNSYPGREAIDRAFDTLSRAKEAAGVAGNSQIHLTNEELMSLSENLKNNSWKTSVFEGLLMGDGSLHCPGEGNKNATLSVGMTNRRFLEWYDDIMGSITTGVILDKTAEESAEHARNTGFRPNAKAENYSGVYRVRTRRLPYFTSLYEQWYPSGEKRFPEKPLNSTVAKYWYAGDGGLDITGTHRFNGRCTIKSSNEAHRSEFLKGLFEEHGFVPTFNQGAEKLLFTVQDSKALLEWMGIAPPGFEYKWEMQSYDRYTRLKQ